MQDNIYFILVKPVYLGNIGSIARVMKNFGFHRLRFVDPPRGYKDSEARRMSVDAFDVLKASQVFATLADALQDINLAIGTTSGQQRDMAPLPLHEVAPTALQAAQTNSVAIVFGDERNGLAREELLRCHQVMTIPTNPDFSALNVAQAAAVCAYELSRPFLASTNATAPAPATAPQMPSGEQNDQLFESLGSLLDAAEFSRKFNREKVLSELRGFYHRAQPTEREYELLRGALIKLNQKLIR